MTLVIAHRGASAVELENSPAAFRRAVTLGADGIELDVHAAADGSIIVIHDPVLDGRPLARLTLPQIRQHRLSNGEAVPTLSEALEVIGPTTTVFIEVKSLPAEWDERLFEVMDAGAAPDRYHLHSFDHRIIQRLRQRRPHGDYGVLSASYPVHPIRAMADAGASELWQHDSMTDPALVAAAHRAGYRVLVWTVDDPDRIRALRDMGADGVCTNRPDVAREALA